MRRDSNNNVLLNIIHPINTSLCHTPPALSPTDGLTAFRSFLQSEFSDENIEFWMSCEDFKKTKNPVKMATKAQKIYEDFIQSEGPKEVRDSCDSPPPPFFFLQDQFHMEQKEIINLITCSGPYVMGTNVSLISAHFHMK